MQETATPRVAVANVAVAMRPQNQRRLTTGAIVLGIVAAVVGGLLVMRSPDQSGPAVPAPTARPGLPRATGHLVFGMTPVQVRRLTGRPVRTQGGCWLFDPTKTGVVGSISVQPSFSRVPYNPNTTGPLKLCFLGGVYSVGYLRIYVPSQHRWLWGAWPLTILQSSPPG